MEGIVERIRKAYAPYVERIDANALNVFLFRAARIAKEAAIAEDRICAVARGEKMTEEEKAEADVIIARWNGMEVVAEMLFDGAVVDAILCWASEHGSDEGCPPSDVGVEILKLAEELKKEKQDAINDGIE